MNITVNGISVNYTLEGPASGPVITMSNSLASNLSMWDPQIPVLDVALPRPALRYSWPRRDRRPCGALFAR